MRRPSRPTMISLAWFMSVLTLVSSTGCIGMTSQLLYLIKGQKVPAEFEGLAGKRVAVVCVASSASYDPGSAPSILSQLVEGMLRQNVDDVKMVRHDEVVDWIDNHDWDEVDYRDVGRGVNADAVVSIELENYRLHEDATMFKGRANVTVKVHDMQKKGEVLFRRSFTSAFPVNGGQHVSETDEQQFQRKFLFFLAQDISRLFYAYEFKEDFARDAAMIHQ